MLITPRTYSAAQTPDRGLSLPTSQRPLKFHTLTGWHSDAADTIKGARMLLSYQAGSVRVGEVVRFVISCSHMFARTAADTLRQLSRYTITYTPAADPIYPPPAELYVKVRNTSATPLRAAYLHGPYTLYAACYPSTFDPNVKYEQQETEGVPQFEPYLKAGGSWDATITVPQRIRATPTELASADPESRQSVTWVVEIVSQIIFSNTAAVNFEVLVGRDEKSIQLSTGGITGNNGLPQPAQLQEHRSSKARGDQVVATAGIYSKSITLLVDDTASLWNSPPFPSSDKAKHAETGSPQAVEQHSAAQQEDAPEEKKKKKIHLVVLTHGLHSNLGADMLYLKESIDASARKAKEQAKQHRRKSKGENQTVNGDDDDDDDDEQVIVRGFFGNAVRTERGIQYLGKRLAKYVLLMTYPDQSYTPAKSSKDKGLSNQLAALKLPTGHTKGGSSTPDSHKEDADPDGHAYQITSISFIGHSLGGLIQTYAIAYIQKHSPQFFDRIKPVNFVALASPFLGLSNENPVYVRFALDLGLVGRTGQDLGLSWTAPKVRSGWGAMIGGKGEAVKSQGPSDPGAKPLLRILPCGPAHQILAKFQHRTIYSNVVNDGIVPLRTSSLLFLDWRGLDRVEKARRDNGLVGTMAEWGWAEITGANTKSPRSARSPMGAEGRNIDHFGTSAVSSQQPSETEASREDVSRLPEQGLSSTQAHGNLGPSAMSVGLKHDEHDEHSTQGSSNPLASFVSLFRPKDHKNPHSHKQKRILNRSQTIPANALDNPEPSTRPHDPDEPARRESHEDSRSNVPPRTTFLESASDLLMPPLPPIEFLLDPAARPRTIFHDRIYHPDDIPAPLPEKRRALTFGSSQDKNSKAPAASSAEPHVSSHNKDDPESGLRVEEKIARAYHRDLSWRKVLVRLEPDAHNNIIVRRMFTNAYGWPVVKHLVDTHFGHTSAAQSYDISGAGEERAKSPMAETTRSGNEIKGQTDPPANEAPVNNKENQPEDSSPSVPSGANIHANEADVPAQIQLHPELTLPIPKEPELPKQNGSGLSSEDDHDAAVPEQQLNEGNAA